MANVICSYCKKNLGKIKQVENDSHGACDDCYKMMLKKIRGKEMSDKEYFIYQISIKYSETLILTVLADLKLSSLAEAFDKGKKNMVSDIIRDRSLFNRGHSLIGEMQYDRFGSLV